MAHRDVSRLRIHLFKSANARCKFQSCKFSMRLIIINLGDSYIAKKLSRLPLKLLIFWTLSDLANIRFLTWPKQTHANFAKKLLATQINLLILFGTLNSTYYTTNTIDKMYFNTIPLVQKTLEFCRPRLWFDLRFSISSIVLL